MKKMRLFWTGIACIAVGIVLICIAVFLLVQRRPVVPFVPESPLPTPRPLSLIYLPLVMSNHPQSIEHGVSMTYAGLPGACGWLQEMNADWHYNWSPNEIPACSGIEFVPMMRQSSDIGREIPASSQWVLGFNECGIEGQCPDTIHEATVGWRELETEYPNVKLASPATLGWMGYSRLWWIEDWYEHYETLYNEPPRLDALAIHCYGDDVFCQEFLSSAVDFADSIGGLPVWVTEFANPPREGVSEAQMLASMEAMVEWFKANPRVTRWAWFSLTYRGDEDWMPGSWASPYTPLVDFDTGELTPCGELYRTLH